MKSIVSLLLLAATPVMASASDNIHFIRQRQQDTGIIWDMPVNVRGQSPSALALENGGSLFQLWAISPAPARDYLLDQKLVGAYLPKATMKVVTLDPDGKIPRTRVDQPFRVEIEVSDLLTGAQYPLAASSVLLERHAASYGLQETALDPKGGETKAPVQRQSRLVRRVDPEVHLAHAELPACMRQCLLQKRTVGKVMPDLSLKFSKRHIDCLAISRPSYSH